MNIIRPFSRGIKVNEEILSIIKEEFDMVPESFGGKVDKEEID
jgi:hypothetical protein